MLKVSGFAEKAGQIGADGVDELGEGHAAGVGQNMIEVFGGRAKPAGADVPRETAAHHRLFLVVQGNPAIRVHRLLHDLEVVVAQLKFVQHKHGGFLSAGWSLRRQC
jgi:hypothetical protein